MPQPQTFAVGLEPVAGNKEVVVLVQAETGKHAIEKALLKKYQLVMDENGLEEPDARIFRARCHKGDKLTTENEFWDCFFKAIIRGGKTILQIQDDGTFTDWLPIDDAGKIRSRIIE